MITTKELINRGIIKPDVAPYVMQTCPYCGHNIIRNEELTRAKCSNPYCPRHLAERANDLIKSLGVYKGIGVEGLYNIIYTHDITNIFRILRGVNPRPKMSLWEVVKYLGIGDKQEQWEEILAGYVTIEDYLTRAPNPDPELGRHYPMIAEACQYVALNRPLSDVSVNVMMTGGLTGYGSRDKFITEMNEKYGHVVRTVLKRSAVLSAQYLIVDNPETVEKAIEMGVASSKAMKAKQSGARIVSPEYYENLVKEYCKKNATV